MRNMPSNWHIDRLANLLIIKDMNDNKLMNRAADNIRILAASMVEKANSGHPGGDRKSTRLNSSHRHTSRMPSSA